MRNDMTPEELEAQAARMREEERLRACTDPSVLLPKLTEVLGLRRSEVVGVVKLAATPPLWEVRTTRGTVTFASDDLASHPKFKRRLMEATDEAVASMRPREWDDVVDLMLRAATVESIGEEATDAGACAAWLGEYLTARPPVDDLDAAALTEYPFNDEGAVYIYGPNLRRWLWISRGESVTHKRMGVVLRAGHCAPVRLDRVVDGRRVTPAVWRLPHSEATYKG